MGEDGSSNLPPCLMNRRKFIGVLGTATAASIAGCSGDDHGYGECYGDCGKVKTINIDSENGWGYSYTNIIVLFEKDFTGNVLVETYDDAHEIIGFKRKSVERKKRISISFDRFKTHERYKVYVEEN